MLQFLEIVSQDENCMTIWVHCLEREDCCLCTQQARYHSNYSKRLSKLPEGSCKGLPYSYIKTLCCYYWTQTRQIKNEMSQRQQQMQLDDHFSVATISVPIRWQFSSILTDTIYAGTFLGRESYRILSKLCEQLLSHITEFSRTEGNTKFH